MNQHCDIQTTKLSRRKDFINKIENAKKAKMRTEKIKEEEEKKKGKAKNSKTTNNKKKNKKNKLGSQSGILPSCLNFQNSFLSDFKSDRVVSEIENGMALYLALRDSVSTTQSASIFFLYLKNYCSGSVLNQLTNFVKEELNFDLLNPQASDEPDWLSQLRRVKDDWTLIVKNQCFKQISKLISMCASLGLCNLSNMSFNIRGIKVFSIPVYKQHVNALDLCDAFFETCITFIEGGYRCFQTGKLSSFLYSKDEAKEFDDEYFAITELAPFMRAGNLETKKNITENDFDYRLNTFIEKADSLYKTTEGTWEKRVLFDRLTQLRRIRSDFVSYRVDGRLRKAPYAVYIEGASGVGKSTVSALLMRIVLLSNGFNASDERLVTLNEADKFMSNYRSHINGVFADDLGNTKAEFVEKSPVSLVIEIVNNVLAYANMAEVELKGKVSIEPHCLIGTSNMSLSVLAEQYSNEPYSIVRRFPTQLHVTVKEKFRMSDGRLDSSLVHEAFPDGVPVIPDLWDFKLYIPYFDKRNQFRKRVKECNIYDVIAFVKEQSALHFRNQQDVVSYAVNLDTKLKDISWEAPLTNQYFESVSENIYDYAERLRNLDSPWLNWLNYIPASMFDNTRSYQCLTIWCVRRTLPSVGALRFMFFMLMCICFLCFYMHFLLGMVYILFMLILFFIYIYVIREYYIRRIVEARGAMPIVFRQIRDNCVQHIISASAVIGTIYTMIKLYRASTVLNTQGSLSPRTLSEVVVRDKEKNPWCGVHVTKPLVASTADGIQREALNKRVFENLFYIELDLEDKKRFCNAFFVKSNLALIPSHFLTEHEHTISFYRRGENTNGAYFQAKISKTYSYVFPNTDMVLVWVPNAPSMRDLSKYLAVSKYGKTPATMIWKNKNGLREDYKAVLNPGLVRTHTMNFDGFNYVLEHETFQGMCMGVWISNSVAKQILGFHLAGKGMEGGAGLITSKMFVEGELKIRKIEGILLHKSQGTLKDEQYGVKIFTSNDIHFKSPCRYLPSGANVEIYGSVIGSTTAHSSVESTCISRLVEEVCGVPQQWGPPQFGPQRWKPWQESLSYASKPSIGVDGYLLKQAVVDYKVPLVKILMENDFIRKEIAPLTDMQTVCGIDGKRFIDKMKPSTSVGYPLSGPKSDYLIILDPTQYNEFQCPVELDEKFWVEWNAMQQEYLAGRRAYPIFKAALKDEPTVLTKEKVRVFQAAPIALQLGVRKYFLPVARFLSLYPLVSECAVGINAQGPEWHEMSQFVMKYGEDRILAGDYSKYDLRMPCQLIAAAFRILIDLAERSGNYNQQDILIMSGIASDIMNPVIAYNGDLLMLFGSNPSGQNLTVYINSIVNSLLFRSAYFSIYEGINVPPFRQVCAMLTYGDDVKSSVKEGWDSFNHLSVAAFLAKQDMKFTMPDKESTPTKYMRDEDADFLKRKNVYNKQLGMFMAALDEKSIFKSLHSVLASKAVTNEQQCMENIDGALREWFAYGEEVYEHRRFQMDEIATKAGLRYGCSQLDVSYQEALLLYCQKYDLVLNTTS